MSKRILKGKAISVKMKDTVVVAVISFHAHSKYRKIIKIIKKYKAHYTGGGVDVGDTVLIEESRPISKDKRWVVRALSKSEASGDKTLPR